MTAGNASAPRLALGRVVPDIHRAMLRVDTEISGVASDAPLLELVRIRASQINGCAFCLDMHTKDARAMGEREQRIYALNAWRDTPFFSERERAALALVEAVTQLKDGDVSDAVYDDAVRHFEPGELAALIAATAMINAWNRVAITTRMVAGRYEPRAIASSGQHGAS